jgi:hypothetical protein
LSDLSPTTLELDDAARSLGARHPLTRALRWQRVAAHHVAVVALLGGIAAAGTRANAAWGPPFLVATAAMVTVLACVIAGATWSKHRAATELIAHGQEHVALASVALQRKRLLRPVHRERVARTYESIVCEAVRPSRQPVPARRPYADRQTVYPLSAELLKVARLLRVPSTDAIGLARAEQFLSHGVLIFADPSEIRVELEELIRLLEAATRRAM